MTLLLLGGPTVLEADERVALPFIFDTPTEANASLPSSEAIDRLTRLLLTHTDFAPREVPGKSIEGCRGSVVCMALRMTSRIRDAMASHMMVVSNLTHADQPDRVSVLLIDLVAAVECSDTYTDPLRQERCATERALVASDLAHPIEGAEEMKRHLRDVVTRILRPALEGAKHWEPFGSIDVTTERRNTVISLDGRTVGSIGAGRGLITGVRPGARTLQYRSTEDAALQVDVEVTRGSTTSVTLPRTLEARGPSATLVAAWSLLGVGAASLLSGSILLHDASQSRTQLYDAPPSEEDFYDGLGEVTAKRTSAFVLFGLSAASLVASLILDFLDLGDP